jgi:hypothetical protein
MTRILLAALAAAVLSGCAGGQLVNRYGAAPLDPPQAITASGAPVSAAGSAVMYDGRGIYSTP